MTHTLVARGFILTLWLGASTTMLAQSSSATAYERAAEITITGTIMHLFSPAAPDGSVGVHLDLKTAGGLVNVHVAPAMFIGQSNFWFYADDQIEVTGTRVSLDGNTAFWAKAIRKGSTALILRNDDGTPKWAPASDGTDGCGVNHAALPRGTER